MNVQFLFIAVATIGFLLGSECNGQVIPSATQLQKLLNRFPAADTNGDGTLSRDEAIAFRNTLSAPGKADWRTRARGIKREFKINPGWDLKRFPSPELDRMFRKIAWQAVAKHPFSGVSDQDGDGLNDSPNVPVEAEIRN